jgi:hypothetical protein
MTHNFTHPSNGAFVNQQKDIVDENDTTRATCVNIKLHHYSSSSCSGELTAHRMYDKGQEITSAQDNENNYNISDVADIENTYSLPLHIHDDNFVDIRLTTDLQQMVDEGIITYDQAICMSEPTLAYDADGETSCSGDPAVLTFAGIVRQGYATRAPITSCHNDSAHVSKNKLRINKKKSGH